MKNKIISSLLIIFTLAAVFLSLCFQRTTRVDLPSDFGESNYTFTISYGFPALVTKEADTGINDKIMEIHFANIMIFIYALFVPIFFAGYLLGKNKTNSNQQVDPIVKTPVDKVETQGTQGHP